MITVKTADEALKSFYLDAVTEALDLKVNPLLAQIARTTTDVVGKEVKKVVRMGINGGISAGGETDSLPSARTGDRVTFTAPLKNLYGTIEISDKALRASANNEGAFVDILNDEMQSLIKSASFNFGRMLYGDGSGRLATIEDFEEGNQLYLDSVQNIVEGMYVDFSNTSDAILSSASNRKVLEVNREEKYIIVEGAEVTMYTPAGGGVYLHGSKGNEITGLGAIFGNQDLYGVPRSKGDFMKPYVLEDIGTIDEGIIQEVLDKIEEKSGSTVNFIVCSWGVRRTLLEQYRQNKVVMPTIEFEGGFKALSFNGIPIFADRFCPSGTMYLLNTNDFKLCQLCDWKWLEGEDGKVLKQVPGKPVYTATLVKYVELLCERPGGQGIIKDIAEA